MPALRNAKIAAQLAANARKEGEGDGCGDRLARSRSKAASRLAPNGSPIVRVSSVVATSLALRLVIVMGLWAGCFPLITLGLGLAQPLLFAALRAALAGVLLLALGAVLRRPVPCCRSVWGLIVFVGLTTTTLGFLGMFHAAESISPGIATAITNAQPLLAAILAHAFLRERLRREAILGCPSGSAASSQSHGPDWPRPMRLVTRPESPLSRSPPARSPSATSR